MVKDQTPWSETRKFFFRFSLLYILLYTFPFAAGVVPIATKLDQIWNDLTLPLTSWIGLHLFSVSDGLSTAPTGSGDTMFEYLQAFTFALVCVFASLLWSLVDRKRPSYVAAEDGLRILLRYHLAVVLLGYGLYKVVRLQFPEPDLARLVQPFGSFTPMGLAWSFMGYSYPYTFFGGLCEVTGALLLFFRRTVLIGALLLTIVLTNVVLINFTYDVPVKLFSLHLFLFATYLLIPSAKRLMNLLLLNRTVQPADHSMRFWSVVPPSLRIGLKAVFIGGTLFFAISDVVNSWHYMNPQSEDPSLYGIYEVKDFVVNQDTLPPLVTDTARWRYLLIDKNVGAIVNMNDKRIWIQTETDTVLTSLRLTTLTSTPTLYSFHYNKQVGYLHLNGKSKSDSLHIRCKELRKEDFPIFRTGFNWINEKPNNQ